MKRKSLKLLALAVPLVGLALVWGAGARLREQQDVPNRVCEVAMRAILQERLPVPWAKKVFVSVDGHDPSASFLASFAEGRTVMFPASAYVSPRAYRSDLPRLLEMRCRADGGSGRRTVVVSGVPFHGSILYSLKLQGKQWRVVSRSS